MDDVFSENMELMQELQLSFKPTAEIDAATARSINIIATTATACPNQALNHLKAESFTLIKDYSVQLTKDTTSQLMKDSIICDIKKNTAQAQVDMKKSSDLILDTPTKAINLLQSIKTNMTLDIDTQKNSIIQEMIDLRDGVVTNIAPFQN